MIANGQNYLQVKHPQQLQKAFSGDWTISFALRFPDVVEHGFWGYFFLKGNVMKNACPVFCKNADGNAMIMKMNTVTATWMGLDHTPPFPPGIWT